MIQYLNSRLAYIEEMHSGTITSHIKVILHPSILLESQLAQIEPPKIPKTDHSVRFEHLGSNQLNPFIDIQNLPLRYSLSQLPTASDAAPKRYRPI